MVAAFLVLFLLLKAKGEATRKNFEKIVPQTRVKLVQIARGSRVADSTCAFNKLLRIICVTKAEPSMSRTRYMLDRAWYGLVLMRQALL